MQPSKTQTEQEFQLFIDELVKKHPPIEKEAQIAYFDAITTGKQEYYKKAEELQVELERIYNNKEDFLKIKKFKEKEDNIKDLLLKRQLTILYNYYLGSQGNIELIKKIVEKSTKIEKEFNTFRAKINNKEYTENDLREILKTETDSSKLEQAWSSSKVQGQAVEKELIELVKLRNQLAKERGFNDYYEMSLLLSDQDPKEILKIFKELEDLTNKPFKDIKKEIDNILSKKYNTTELKPWHYQDFFFQEAPKIYSVDLDKYYSTIDVVKVSEQFYESIGLLVKDILEKSDLYEKPGKYQHACCIFIDRLYDTRIVESVKNNQRWMETTLHELGHAVYNKNINKNLPFFLRWPAHIFTTEAIAMLFERQPKNSRFIKKYTNVEDKDLLNISEQTKKMLRLKSLVFSRWAQVMMHFEKELYNNPSQDLNKLWYKLVKKYQLLDFSRDKPDWAAKIHFTTSPAYYHNYLLGEILASQLHNQIATFLKNPQDSYENNKKVGDYLKSKVFSLGKSLEWNNMIKQATGEYLTAKYFFEEFCK